ncbi:MAG: AI-2E family transporter [bacterium]
MKYTFDRVIRILIGVATVVVILLTINYLRTVLLPFFIGWLLAYLINPLVGFVQNKMRVKIRILSIAISLISIISVLSILCWLFLPLISAEIVKGSALINEFLVNKNSGFLPAEVKQYIVTLLNQIDISKFLNAQSVELTFNKLIPQLQQLIAGTFNFVAGIFVVFIIFLYVVFILIDYDKITTGFRKMIPQKYRHLIEGIIDDLEKSMNRYFRGQSMVAFCVGILFAIGFKIIGLPLGITIGLFIGVLNLVPYLQMLGFVPVTLLAWLHSAETGESFWIMIGLCALVFIVVQSTQDLVIVPRIMRKAMGLNPAIILLSLSIGAYLLGLIGMILALPSATLLISYYKRFILGEIVAKKENTEIETVDTPDEN